MHAAQGAASGPSQNPAWNSTSQFQQMTQGSEGSHAHMGDAIMSGQPFGESEAQSIGIHSYSHPQWQPSQNQWQTETQTQMQSQWQPTQEQWQEQPQDQWDFQSQTDPSQGGSFNASSASSSFPNNDPSSMPTQSEPSQFSAPDTWSFPNDSAVATDSTENAAPVEGGEIAPSTADSDGRYMPSGPRWMNRRRWQVDPARVEAAKALFSGAIISSLVAGSTSFRTLRSLSVPHVLDRHGVNGAAPTDRLPQPSNGRAANSALNPFQSSVQWQPAPVHLQAFTSRLNLHLPIRRPRQQRGPYERSAAMSRNAMDEYEDPEYLEEDEEEDDDDDDDDDWAAGLPVASDPASASGQSITFSLAPPTDLSNRCSPAEARILGSYIPLRQFDPALTGVLDMMLALPTFATAGDDIWSLYLGSIQKKAIMQMC